MTRNRRLASTILRGHPTAAKSHSNWAPRTVAIRAAMPPCFSLPSIRKSKHRFQPPARQSIRHFHRTDLQSDSWIFPSLQRDCFATISPVEPGALSGEPVQKRMIISCWTGSREQSSTRNTFFWALRRLPSSTPKWRVSRLRRYGANNEPNAFDQYRGVAGVFAWLHPDGYRGRESFSSHRFIQDKRKLLSEARAAPPLMLGMFVNSSTATSESSTLYSSISRVVVGGLKFHC